MPRLLPENQTLTSDSSVNPAPSHQTLSQDLSNRTGPPPDPGKQERRPALEGLDGGSRNSFGQKQDIQCRNRPVLTTRLVGAFTDEGYFCGWISPGDAAGLMLAKLGRRP